MVVPARLELRGNDRLAHFRAPPSTYLSGALGADGWLVLPAEHAEYKQGESVEMELSFASTFTVLPSSDEDEATRWERYRLVRFDSGVGIRTLRAFEHLRGAEHAPIAA